MKFLTMVGTPILATFIYRCSKIYVYKSLGTFCTVLLSICCSLFHFWSMERADDLPHLPVANVFTVFKYKFTTKAANSR